MSEPFGNYKLHKKIAQGGMAEVFLASRTSEVGGFEKYLAIKRIFSHLVNQEEIVNMFIDEARIAARLEHPNIVQIYDLGMVEESFFIAMEYIDGLDLRRLCELGVKRRNFIPRHLAVYLIAQVAAGLHYAHSRRDEQGNPMNIVHRDVSPQNVLISSDGAVKLCDFGIAKAESRLTNTRTGEFKGKFAYMSPEQFGQGTLDRRSDIFTLGILLYEITVATRLFRARSEYETMRRITEGEVRRPSDVRLDYPPELERIVMKALALKADDRYQTAQELQEDLEEWLFKSRLRVGPRYLSGYLSSLLEEGGPGVMEEEATEAEEVDFAKPSLDSTIELTLSDGELFELQELEEEETVVDLRYAFDEEGEAPTQVVVGSAQAVEVRHISVDEARERQRRGEEGGELDSTLVELRVDDQTTFPVHKTPKVEVDLGEVDLGEVDPEEEPLLLTEVVDDAVGAEWGRSESGARFSEEDGGDLLEEVPELRAGGRRLSGLYRAKETADGGMEPPQGARPLARTSSTGVIFDRRRVFVMGGTVIAVVLLGLLFVLLSGRSEGVAESAAIAPVVTVDELEVVGEDELMLQLESDPPGASVIANGLLVEGKTPLAVPLVVGKENELWVLKGQHRPERFLVAGDELVAADGEGALERAVKLERVKTTELATLEFRSAPLGAMVWLNGEKIGRAPLRLEGVRADFPAHVQYELPGHRPFVAWVDLEAQEERRIRGALSSDGDEVVRGRLEPWPEFARAILSDEISFAGPVERAFSRGQWLDLSFEDEEYRPRQHILRLDRIGSFYIATRLEQAVQEVGRLSLEVRPRSAIYIDSKSFGSGPLRDLELPAGERTIVVETMAGSRLRVPLEVEADGGRSYLVVIDGEEVQVSERDLGRKD